MRFMWYILIRTWYMVTELFRNFKYILNSNLQQRMW